MGVLPTVILQVIKCAGSAALTLSALIWSVDSSSLEVCVVSECSPCSILVNGSSSAVVHITVTLLYTSDKTQVIVWALSTEYISTAGRAIVATEMEVDLSTY